MKKPQVFFYWITGLSGAGKTTIGNAFRDNLLSHGIHAVFLDGDELRDVLSTEGDSYSHAARRRLAMSYAKLGMLLTRQGFNVICCTVSMFHSVRQWNRDNIPGYREIYIKVPISELKRRDQKGIYSGHAEGKHKNVMGLDLEFEEPLSPDIVIENGHGANLDDIQHILIKKFLSESEGNEK